MSAAILYMSWFPLLVVSLTGAICLPDSWMPLGVVCVVGLFTAPIAIVITWIMALIESRQIVERSDDEYLIEGWLLCHVFRIHRYKTLEEAGPRDKYKDKICKCCGASKYAATKYNLREKTEEKTLEELREMHQAKMPKKLKDGLFVEAI